MTAKKGNQATKALTTRLLAGLAAAAAVAVVATVLIVNAANQQDGGPERSNIAPGISPSPIGAPSATSVPGSTDGPSSTRVPDLPAPPFTLPAVDGSSVSLADFRGGQNVLLYFSEAADCPPGWQQAQNLQADLDKFQALNVRPLVVMFESLDVLKAETGRRGLARLPFLSDKDLQVTRSFGALGGMHAEKPRHAFVLIDKDGRIIWRWDYAGEDVTKMYVPDETILQQVGQALQAS